MIANVLTAAAAALALAPGAAAQAISPFYPMFYIDAFADTSLCVTGEMQTPIDIPSDVTPVPAALALTNITMPTIVDLKIVNTGHSLKVEWGGFAPSDSALTAVPSGGDSISAVMTVPGTDATRTVRVQPIQFHFHSMSEHSHNGLYYPMESHIVTLVAEGEAPDWGCDDVWNGGDAVLERCAAVFGTFYKYGATSPSWFKTMLANGPKVAGESAPLAAIPSLDLDELVPANKDYFTYVGSLTTPGCNEGLRWHVFNEPLEVSPDDIAALYNWQANTLNPAVGVNSTSVFRCNHRTIQPLNGRTVWYTGDVEGADISCSTDGVTALESVTTGSAVSASLLGGAVVSLLIAVLL